ncbi:hypothetical protein HaLaN_19943 [Haematococcus lacustris]|uniref:Uncharacterized protein n=1 Tax=Haematococcus lacustris TaxID=44745 RepID=A0A699ZMT5_HAELA|nr:hypothetical protein HaLaN_19943 [Haematococcus lacustris]
MDLVAAGAHHWVQHRPSLDPGGPSPTPHACSRRWSCSRGGGVVWDLGRRSLPHAGAGRCGPQPALETVAKEPGGAAKGSS